MKKTKKTRNGRGEAPVLLEVGQDTPGFGQFIGVWLISGDLNLVVDVGPARSAGRLIRSLEENRIENLDYVLLTHIHVDHCGALSDILSRYPGAKVICHRKAVGHLLDPSGLWEGSRKVLGTVAEGYGRPEPIPEAKVIPHTAVDLDGLQIVETPGHAPHHLSFGYGGMLFSGEAAGNYFLVKGKEYLRPATPPRLFLDTFLDSVNRLLNLDDRPICYAHCGKAESSHRMLGRFLEQLALWQRVIGDPSVGGLDAPVEVCLRRLLEEDFNLGALEGVDEQTRRREIFFLKSSIRGFLGYYREKTKGEDGTG